MLTQINHIWVGLDSRERLLVKGLGIFLILTFIYVVVWSPIQDNKRQAQQHLQNAESQWKWLNSQIPAILQTNSIDSNKRLALTNQNQLMSLLQKTLKQQNLFKDIKTLQGTSQGGKVAFEKVNAVRLFKWLGQLEQQSLVANKVQATWVEPGVVKVDINFKLAKA
jgi:general secretion pathway protein M